MNVCGPDPKYMIHDVELNRTREDCIFRWKYKQGNYFMIVVTSAANDVSLEHVVSLLEERNLTDEEIFSSHSGPVYSSQKELYKIYVVKETSFRKKNLTWNISNQELMQRMPYSITVYNCECDKEAGEYSVYDTKDGMNMVYIPCTIAYSCDVKRGGLLGIGGGYYAILNVRVTEGFKDGDLAYRANGVDIPLTARSLGRDLYIALEDSAKPTLRANSSASKLYRFEEKINGR